MKYESLIQEAFEARKRSYAPYSNFNVGAALLATNGKVFKGCNIENAAHTPSCCGERTAFVKAVSESVLDFDAIAIVAAQHDARPEEFKITAPCGVCRQVMAEFCEPSTFKVILATSETNYEVYTLEELLPLSFSTKDVL